MNNTHVLEFYKTKQLKTKPNIKDDLLHGEYLEFYENGQICIKANYDGGWLHGKYQEFWDNGNLKYEVEYIEDREQGEFKRWNVNGTLAESGTYVDGRIHGELRMWNYRGFFPSVYANYIDDKRCGEFITWNVYGTKSVYFAVDDNLLSDSELGLLIKLVSRIQRKIQIAKQFGLSFPRFKRCIKLLKSREFCEWWYHPDNYGGRRTKRLLSSWINNTIS
jgi:hypothetical protein